MKKHRRFLAIGLVVISLMSSGCGTTLYELTAEEEELIVKYAAQFVAKHNIYQKDGISGVDAEAWEDESEESSDSETENTDDTQNPETDDPSQDMSSIVSALGLADGLTLTHTEDIVADYIKEGAGYSVDAGEGFTFYVMKFNLENTTEQDIEVDNVSVYPTFELTSGSVEAKSTASFLSDDLSTYQGIIKAGETEELLLLFKVKTDDAEKISNPAIQIATDDVTK